MKKYPPNIDCNKALEKMKAFLQRHLKKSRKERFIVGLSGGIDSAVATSVVAESLGKERIVVAKMPYKTSSPQSEKDANLIIEKYNLKSYRIDISQIVDSYFEKNELLFDETFGNSYNLRKGNYAARIRMAILFDLSVKENALVLGTGNKSEILLGYTTWYGDSASSLNPLGDLYKQQVYQLARFLRVPNNIIKKAPSADLWANQTDEGEMGVKYKVADAVLYLIFDEKKSPEQVSKILSLKMELISKILQRVKNNEFKRKLPPILKISR